VAGVVLGLGAPRASAFVALDSIGTGAGVGSVVDQFNWLAPTFTTGPSRVRIQEIHLSLSGSSNATASLGLRLYRLNASFLPDVKLASALASLDYTLDYQTFSFDGTALGELGNYILSPTTGYAIVLSRDVIAAPLPVLEDNGISEAFNEYSFGGGFGPAGDGYYQSGDAGENWNTVLLTPTLRVSVKELIPSVPGPLPVFGAAAAFGYSRKLRKRIAPSKALPVASAID
jgi:hypothetical protein